MSKGSNPRPIEDCKQYGENFERIFNSEMISEHDFSSDYGRSCSKCGIFYNIHKKSPSACNKSTAIFKNNLTFLKYVDNPNKEVRYGDNDMGRVQDDGRSNRGKG